MSWHSFQKGVRYPVLQIIQELTDDLESGRVSDVDGKTPLIELFEKVREQIAVYTPFGSGWDSSPYNPKVWKTEDDKDLISGYREGRSRKTFSQAVRKAVSDKTDGHCYSCGRKFNDVSEIWIKHIIAFSVGGSDELSNLLPGCRICNYTRQNFTPKTIQRILSIGSVMVRQIDKETPIGQETLSFLVQEDDRLAKSSKHKDQSFLVYKREQTK
jgi:5-methylcytosine-specific restriction endonuclease McrA